MHEPVCCGCDRKMESLTANITAVAMRKSGRTQPKYGLPEYVPHYKLICTEYRCPECSHGIFLPLGPEIPYPPDVEVLPSDERFYED